MDIVQLWIELIPLELIQVICYYLSPVELDNLNKVLKISEILDNGLFWKNYFYNRSNPAFPGVITLKDYYINKFIKTNDIISNTTDHILKNYNNKNNPRVYNDIRAHILSILEDDILNSEVISVIKIISQITGISSVKILGQKSYIKKLKIYYNSDKVGILVGIKLRLNESELNKLKRTKVVYKAYIKNGEQVIDLNLTKIIIKKIDFNNIVLEFYEEYLE